MRGNLSTVSGRGRLKILRFVVLPFLLGMLLVLSLMLASTVTTETDGRSETTGGSNIPRTTQKRFDLPWEGSTAATVGDEVDLLSLLGVDGSAMCSSIEAKGKGDQSSSYDDVYDSANEGAQIGDLYSSVHCIDGENMDGSNGIVDPPLMDGSMAGTSSYKPPKGPFFGPSGTYGFNVINRSCFYTNVLYQYPQKFTVFLPDTAHNRKLHADRMLVLPVTLASRPYDGLLSKKRMVAHSYDYRPNVVFGMVPGRADRLLKWLEKHVAGTKRDSDVYQFIALLRTYSNCDVLDIPEKYFQPPYVATEGGETLVQRMKARRVAYCQLVKGITDHERKGKGASPALGGGLQTDCAIIAYYTPIVAPWNYAHTLFCDLFGLFWAAYDFVVGSEDATRSQVRRWHWHVGGGADTVRDLVRSLTRQSAQKEGKVGTVSNEAVGNDEVIQRFGRQNKGIVTSNAHTTNDLSSLWENNGSPLSSVFDGHWASVTSRRSSQTGLHTIETNPPASESLWQRTQALVRGRKVAKPDIDSTGLKKMKNFNGFEVVGEEKDSSRHAAKSILDASVPRPDMKIVATHNHYAKAFELPNKNKAFEMFSNYEHLSNAQRKDDHASPATTFKGAIYDVSLRNNTIYRGLLAGIGTKSWSWVTDTYAASGNPHVWYAFRKHVYEVTGAEPLEWPPVRALKAEDRQVTKEEASDPNMPSKQSTGDPNALRISICHKKDKRGVVNYEDTLKVLEEHFSPLLQPSAVEKSGEFDMTFVLEAAIGKTADKQVEMMDRADIFMCNEGTLATSFFLMGPGSVFISLPLVYHMANLHRMQMPPPEEWWKEPDLLRPDPRKNTGGNIDWFPQAIPWVRTFWYDYVPLNETKIQTPLKGLRNYMPEWNIVVEREKVARLYEKVLGYLISQGHPKTQGLLKMIETLTKDSGANNKDKKTQLLIKIRYWRDVFEARQRLKGDNKMLKSSKGTHDKTMSSALSYLRPRHPAASSTKDQKAHDGVDDDEHNFSINARLCKTILAATPGWSVAFNGVKCLYGMSWLCEFWTNTRFQSRRLHPKWDKSGGKCGDIRTTVPEASKLLKEKNKAIEGNMLFDPRTGDNQNSDSQLALSEPAKSFLKNSNILDFYSLSHDDQQVILRFAASSPFLFSSTSDFPRNLEAYLFYDPSRVRSVYGTTDIRLSPIEEEELIAIFGSKYHK